MYSGGLQDEVLCIFILIEGLLRHILMADAGV